MEAAAIKTFINSGGKVTEFSFNEGDKIVTAGDKETIIFDGNKENYYIPLDEIMDTYEDIYDKEIIDVIGGADKKTAIYIASSPLVTVLLLAIFVLCFIIFYILKIKK